MMNNSYVVIMAGGKGERFWPLSTSKNPKQFLRLLDNKTMIEKTLAYIKGVVPLENILVITNIAFSKIVHKLLPQIPRKNIITEPLGRNTAPACILASTTISSRNENSVICIMTSDHLISNTTVFKKRLKAAFAYALQHDTLITFGIKPTKPHTGYGYIEVNNKKIEIGDTLFFNVRRFIEKPDYKHAVRYFSSGRFYWNSGIFVWSIPSFNNAIQKNAPDLYNWMEYLKKSLKKKSFQKALLNAYSSVTNISIDYALMEKAKNIMMIEGDFAWDDIGSWEALSNYLPCDTNKNYVIGKCEMINSSNNIVFSKDKLTAMVGIKDIIVVSTNQVTLVCSRSHSQEIKQLLNKIKGKPNYQHLI